MDLLYGFFACLGQRRTIPPTDNHGTTVGQEGERVRVC